MRRTVCGLTPLKGSKCGRRLFSRKPKNTCSSTDPVVVYTSNIPLSPTVPIAETRFPRQSDCVSLARIPVEYMIAGLFNYEGDYVLV